MKIHLLQLQVRESIRVYSIGEGGKYWDNDHHLMNEYIFPFLVSVLPGAKYRDLIGPFVHYFRLATFLTINFQQSWLNSLDNILNNSLGEIINSLQDVFVTNNNNVASQNWRHCVTSFADCY